MSSIELFSEKFGDYNFLTVPIGLIGLLSLIRFATKSSSSLLTLTAFYLLSLVPIVSNGVFFGTALFSALFVGLASVLELNLIVSLCLTAIGCIFQYAPFLANGSDKIVPNFEVSFYIKIFDI
jgi:hypothetical protein